MKNTRTRPESDEPSLPRPAEVLNEQPMRLRQWVIIALCIAALALDGYDVMSISLAGAGLSEEWGLSRAALGFLLPLELLGMALGSIFIGALSDFWGRRRVMILCLTIMTLGMAVSGASPDITTLAISRVITGLGIGGVLASATALSSEFCNAKYRSVAVVLVAGGFSFGVFIASKLASPLLAIHDWRMIFHVGAAISLVFIPLILFLTPESVTYLERRNARGAHGQIAATLGRLGHHIPFRLGHTTTEQDSISPTRLLKPRYRRTTLILMFAYLMNILTYYYFVKWTPPAVVDLGYSQTDGSEVLAMVSLGGLAGSVMIAVVSRFIRLKLLIIASLFSSAAFVAAFPFAASSVANMMIIGALAGFFLFAVIGGAFGLFAESFPPAILGTGAGLVLGIGRGGAVLGPWCAGLLLTAVSPIMACGSFLAGLAVIFLPPRQAIS